MANTHMRGGHDYGVRHLHAPHGDLLEPLVSQAVQSDPSTADGPLTPRELITLGAVYVGNERNQDPDAFIMAGAMIRIHTRPRRYPLVENFRARIVTQTTDYLIVDKPAGLPVHAMVDNARENILSYLENELARRLYITHRLDIETSGLLLIALSAAAQSELNKQLAAKKIKRHYLAFTQAPVAPGTYVHFMEDSPRAPKIMHDETWSTHHQRCELTVHGCREVNRSALEPYWQIESLSDAPVYQLAVELGTGRTQQIRAQLTHLHASLIGDTLYKNKYYLLDPLTLRRAIGLRAETLSMP